MSFESYDPGRILMGRIPKGADLLGFLTGVCAGENIRAGTIEALGAVEMARLGFYDQRRKVYTHYEVGGGLEILSLTGNISVKDGAPFVHAHAIFCDASGAAMGGHLMEGAVVFACEYVIRELKGKEPVRDFDTDTGLMLWNFKKED